jgi:hypothetical protein
VSPIPSWCGNAACPHSIGSPHGGISSSSNLRQGDGDFGNLNSTDPFTLPALPATHLFLGRLNYLTNMGSNWRMWIWFTGPSGVLEETPFSNEGIHESCTHNNGKDGLSQSIPISYGVMTQNIPSEEIVTHIFMSAWTCQCNGSPHMQGKGEY